MNKAKENPTLPHEFIRKNYHKKAFNQNEWLRGRSYWNIRGLTLRAECNFQCVQGQRHIISNDNMIEQGRQHGKQKSVDEIPRSSFFFSPLNLIPFQFKPYANFLSSDDSSVSYNGLGRFNFSMKQCFKYISLHPSSLLFRDTFWLALSRYI